MNELRLLGLLVFVSLLFVGSCKVLASNPVLENGVTDVPCVATLPSNTELPDLFTMRNGQKISTVKDWERLRRPELIELFQYYMYGYLPPAPKSPQFVVEAMDAHKFNGKATLRIVTIKPDGNVSPFSLLLLLPNQSEKAYPVFIGLNFVGNHTVSDFPEIPLPDVWVNPGWSGSEEPVASDAQRGIRSNRWPLEMIIDRGYGVATIYAGEISPDYSQVKGYEGCVDGPHRAYLASESGRPVGSEWGQVAAWAWGIQRGVDYLVNCDFVNPNKIIAVGHSRLGKAALLAGALDERIAVVIPSQAGSGATSPSRFNVGESIGHMNDRFPLWFNEVFKSFNHQVDRLPFDQHALLALVAPRPLLLTNATGDQWADPEGQFNMLLEASQVYELYGKEGLTATEFPDEDLLIDSRLGYFIRAGSHDMTKVEWNAWMDFCAIHLDEK